MGNDLSVNKGPGVIWQNHLLVGALAFEELRKYEIEGDQLVHSEMLLKGMGRVRDIKTAPDG